MNLSVNAFRRVLTTNKWLQTAWDLLVVTFSLLPYAWGVNQFLVPHNIVAGGITGISEMVYFLSSGWIPIWGTTLTINVLLLAVAIPLLGLRFCFGTIWAVFSLAFWFRMIPIATVPVLHDPFMSCVVAGMFCGAGVGMAMTHHASSGGTDIIAMIVNKYKRVDLGKTLFVCDLIIISSSYFLPNIRSLEPIAMSLCFTFMMTIAVDTVTRHARQSVQFFIFSMYKSKEIAAAINKEVNRGCTILKGQGGYSRKSIDVLTVLAHQWETEHIFQVIKEIDPSAFVSQTNARGVYGKGFETVLSEKEQERARILEEQFAAEENNQLANQAAPSVQ